MPIPAKLAERLANRAPEVLQVRIGRKVPGKDYPTRLDHFIFVRMDGGKEIAEDNELAKIFDPDGKPRALPIRLLFETEDDNVHSFLASYDSRRAFCTNHEGGNTAKRRKGKNGDYEAVECDPDSCPIWQKGECKMHAIFRFGLRHPNGSDVTGFNEIATFRTTGWQSAGQILAGVRGALKIASGIYELLLKNDPELKSTLTLSDVIAQIPYRLGMSAIRSSYGTMFAVSVSPEIASDAIYDLLLGRARKATLTLGGFRELKALMPAQVEAESTAEYDEAIAEEFHTGTIDPDDLNAKTATMKGAVEYGATDAEFDDSPVAEELANDADSLFNPPPPSKNLTGFQPVEEKNALSFLYNRACRDWSAFRAELNGLMYPGDMPPDVIGDAKAVITELKKWQKPVQVSVAKALGWEGGNDK